MDLRKAMEVVVRSGLQNHQGGIHIEVPEEKIDEVVNDITNNDYFLIEFESNLEDSIATYLENHRDELGLAEEE